MRAISLSSQQNLNATLIQPVPLNNSIASCYLSQEIPYQIPGTDLLIYIQSQPQAALMQRDSLDRLIDATLGDFDQVILQRGADFPFTLNPFLKAEGNLVISVDRRYYKRAFTYGNAVRVLLAIQSQMPRLNYHECYVRVFQTQPARGTSSISIGHVVIWSN